MEEKQSDINIKDPIYLLSLLVFFVGIVFTETYYTAFNIKYQTLSLPVFHIIYRGLTAIFLDWRILIIYAFSAIWLAFQNSIVQALLNKQRWLAVILPYCFVGFVVAANYPLARSAGNRAAKADMHEVSCTLPKVISIAPQQGQAAGRNFAGSRLFGTEGSYIVLFWPLNENVSDSVPHIYRISKEEANVIQTSVK